MYEMESENMKWEVAKWEIRTIRDKWEVWSVRCKTNKLWYIKDNVSPRATTKK